MPICHRQNDLRACGAETTVVGQDFVKVEGMLWAVSGDTCTHASGGLINTQDYVFISGLPVILLNDQADADALCIPLGGAHCDPFSASGSSLITVTG